MERKGLTPDDIRPHRRRHGVGLRQLKAGLDVHRRLPWRTSTTATSTTRTKGERKFACISGTQSLDDAYNWIRAGRHRGKKAIVIATDTALYARDDPGEATQGAGAVAMLVDEDPSLVELSTEQGFGSADETDFLKPNQQFPSVDGKRSMKVYLARLREALEDYESQVGGVHPEDF